MPCARRNCRKSPKPHPTSSKVRPWKSPSEASVAKRFSCDERLRKPRPRWSKPKVRTLSSYQRAVAVSGSKALLVALGCGAQQLGGRGSAGEQCVERHEPRHEACPV